MTVRLIKNKWTLLVSHTIAILTISNSLHIPSTNTLKHSSIIIYFWKIKTKNLKTLSKLRILKVPRSLRFLIVFRIQLPFHFIPCLKADWLSCLEKDVIKLSTSIANNIITPNPIFIKRIPYIIWYNLT